MTRAEMTLKVVMSPSEPLESFVEQYIKLVPDVDTNEFQRVLDMKGIRKVDQAPFLDYFRSSAPQASAGTNPMSVMLSPTAGGVSSTSGAATNVIAGKEAAAVVSSSSSQASTSTPSGGESRIKKLENLIKKRL